MKNVSGKSCRQNQNIHCMRMLSDSSSEIVPFVR